MTKLHAHNATIAPLCCT